jgi:hypothetical protein
LQIAFALKQIAIIPQMTTVQFQLGGTLKFIVEQPATKAGAFVTVRCGAFAVTARGDGMAYTLPDGNKVQVKISYVDAQGNPATVDSEVTWASSDDTIATVQADTADSQKAVVAASGTIGQVQITARADADLGEGVRELITTMDVEVVAGEAVGGTIEPVGPSEPI